MGLKRGNIKKTKPVNNYNNLCGSPFTWFDMDHRDRHPATTTQSQINQKSRTKNCIRQKVRHLVSKKILTTTNSLHQKLNISQKHNRLILILRSTSKIFLLCIFPGTCMSTFNNEIIPDFSYSLSNSPKHKKLSVPF